MGFLTPHKNVCRHQDIYPTLTSTGDIVNLMIFGTGHMADRVKCICCMFCHVVVVQYTKQCFYWIPNPRKYVCRHQDIYPTLTITGDSQFGDFMDRAYGGPFEMYIL